MERENSTTSIQKWVSQFFLDMDVFRCILVVDTDKLWHLFLGQREYNTLLIKM
jgi:hypothetical protein